MFPGKMVREQLTVEARDGEALYTLVFRPEGQARATILHRTPSNARAAGLCLLALHLVSHGFAVVLQDCRGRYNSNGQWDILREGDDGKDTLTWLMKQPWWGGKIGLLGLCYSVFLNGELVKECPTAPFFGCVSIGGTTIHSEFFNEDEGIVFLHWYLPCHYMFDGTVQKMPDAVDWKQLFLDYPHCKDELTVSDTIKRLSWVTQNTPNGVLFEHKNLQGQELLYELPTLHVSGLYDLWKNVTIRDYERAIASTGADVGLHRFLFGPWDHTSMLRDMARYRYCDTGLFLVTEISSWFECCLNGNPSADVSPEVSVPPDQDGAGFLLHWPPDSEQQELFLSASGHLCPKAPESGQLTFWYDSTNPVPTLGGAVWPFSGLDAGPIDQSPLLDRDDILFFSGKRLAKPLRVAGWASVDLYVASSSSECHFTAKLVDRQPGGERILVTDGIARAEACDNGPVKVSVSLGAVNYVFDRGHCIELEISSSNFPKYERYLKNGEHVRQKQTVFLGGSGRSVLGLPLMQSER